jgi:hypothetical protein
LFSLAGFIAQSQVIKGKVLDSNTGEPLVGAVKLDGTIYSTVVNWMVHSVLQKCLLVPMNYQFPIQE